MQSDIICNKYNKLRDDTLFAEQEYIIDKIIDKKIKKGIVFYLVKWIDYIEETTWEPATRLVNLKEFIWEFEEENKDKISKNNSKEKKFNHDKRNITDSNSKVKKPNSDIKIDTPNEIKELYRTKEGEIYLKISWMPRKENPIITPNDSIVNYNFIKKKFPYILIDFYETRCFVNMKRYK